MKALVFAAGLGTRLRPLTNNMPKALVKVGGVPMLERVVNNLKKYGFDDVTINIHHFGQQIIDFVAANNNFGINIHISDERDLLLDTGGGILKARKFLDGKEPFLVHNADILTDLNLLDIYNYHKHHKAVATLLVKERDTARYLLFDDRMNLRGWTNIKTGEVRPNTLGKDEAGELKRLAFGGVHVISPEIFDDLEKHSANPVFSIVPFYYENCGKLLIKGYAKQGAYKWLDVGKPETLAQAQAEFA